MKPYWIIFSARFRLLLQYRAAALAGFGTQLFWGIMRVMIFTGFFQSSSQAQSMTLEETITYIWLGQALLLIVPWNQDQEIQQMIRSGHVAYELARPVDLFLFWFARALAQRSGPLLLRSIPLFLIAGTFLGLTAPISWIAFLMFLLAMIVAVVLSASITLLMNISIFWTLSGYGITRLLASMSMLFSGLIVPLPLFPDWMQPFLNCLPFRGLIDVPFRLYMGHIPAGQAPALILQQLLWITMLLFAGKFFYSHAMKKIIIQGG